MDFELTSEVIKNDLDYYAQKNVEDGPCLTWSMFSIGYQSIGDTDKAYAYFLKGYQGYVQQPWNVWSEIKGGSGARNFLTGGGGFLQSILYGYGGIRVRRDGLEMTPKMITLSQGWTMRSLNYKGKTFDVEVGIGKIMFRCIKGDIVVCQETCEALVSGESIEVKGTFSIHVDN